MYSQAPQNYRCPFCSMVQRGLDSEPDVVLESENTFACVALHQHKGSGPSLLVVPKIHVENIYDISEELLGEVSRVSKHIAIEMRKLWDIQGITIWQHNEKAGSQDVWHFHTHVKGRLENERLFQAKLIEMNLNHRQTLANKLKQHLHHLQ